MGGPDLHVVERIRAVDGDLDLVEVVLVDGRRQLIVGDLGLELGRDRLEAELVAVEAVADLVDRAAGEIGILRCPT